MPGAPALSVACAAVTETAGPRPRSPSPPSLLEPSLLCCLLYLLSSLLPCPAPFLIPSLLHVLHNRLDSATDSAHTCKLST